MLGILEEGEACLILGRWTVPYLSVKEIIAQASRQKLKRYFRRCLSMHESTLQQACSERGYSGIWESLGV